ncbi:S-adenosyl-methionine-sterol-C- methyltransferase [Planoprotostelium fungivorum]|uniref:S-adenosyl-methionine-sterol-C-methyltransferase n=1 Tax=Planoprotostelium fungivorum TaxID=1890364 RepID=A0A2P6NBS0_9EUKA|nr:S-adenosyl-methionine-sterol-C- methyltransferase [Planoprotostelium fungivorum]
MISLGQARLQTTNEFMYAASKRIQMLCGDRDRGPLVEPWLTLKGHGIEKDTMSTEDSPENKPPRPVRPLPSGPSRVQQAANTFNSIAIASNTPPSGDEGTSPVVPGKLHINPALKASTSNPLGLPLRVKESTPPAGNPPKPANGTMSPKGGSFVMLKSSGNSMPPQRLVHAQSYGPTSMPKPLSRSNSNVEDYEESSPYYNVNSPSQEETHDLQLRDARDKIARQNAEITVLKRELDDKTRLELELKTDLEVERQKVRDFDGGSLSGQMSPKRKEKPPPPPEKPSPQVLASLSTSTTNLSAHQLNNQILELKASVAILERENIMLREELDKQEKKTKDDQQSILDMKGQISGLKKEATALRVTQRRAQLDQMPIKPASTHELYEAIFEFAADNEGDLQLSIGDVIELIEKTSDSWWRGTNVETNSSGLFPSNYVQFKGSTLGITEEIVIDETVPVRMIKAIFEYQARDADEISFVKGDDIELLHENDNGWWYVHDSGGCNVSLKEELLLGVPRPEYMTSDGRICADVDWVARGISRSPETRRLPTDKDTEKRLPQLFVRDCIATFTDFCYFGQPMKGSPICEREALVETLSQFFNSGTREKPRNVSSVITEMQSIWKWSNDKVEGAAKRWNTFGTSFKHLCNLTPKEIEDFMQSYVIYNLDWENEEEMIRTLGPDYQNRVGDCLKSYYGVLNHLCALGDVEKMYIPPLMDKNVSVTDNQMLLEEALAKDIGLKAGDRVLEIGCGRGRVAAHMAEMSGCKVTAINIDPNQLAQAREFNEKMGFSNTFIEWDQNNLPLPFEDQSFDAFYQIQAFSLCKDLKASFKEIFRVLKPGAKFAFLDWVSLPAYNPQDPEHAELMRRVKPLIGAVGTPTPTGLEAALKEAGFVVTRSDNPSIDGLQAGLIEKVDLYFRGITALINGLVTVRVLPPHLKTLMDRFVLDGEAFVKMDGMRLCTTTYRIIAQKPTDGSEEHSSPTLAE